jgi:hypothetical protein
MGVRQEEAFSIIIAYVSISLALQFLFVIWMVLGMMNCVGVTVRKEVKKDLLWTQLSLFTIGLVYFIWMEIAYSAVRGGIDPNFCANVFYQVMAFISGMFRTSFMIFLLMKLRATRMSEKVGCLEKFSMGLTALSFVLIFVNVFTLKGGLLPKFGGVICFQQSNQLLMGLLVVLDFLNGALCLYEFNRRLKEVSKKVQESIALTPQSETLNNKSLEKIAQDSKNAGGGAILFYLGNYIFTFIGVYVFKGDEVILIVGFVNVITIVLMSCVIAFFTKSVWIVDGRSPIGKLYTVVASDKNNPSHQQKTEPHAQGVSAESPPKSGSQIESAQV